MNSPVRLGDSPATSIPTGFFSQRFGDFISPAMEPWVERSVLLPSYSSHFICTQMWDHLLHQLVPGPPNPPASTLPWVLSSLAAPFCPSYCSGWNFLLSLLGCRTSKQFDILAVLVIFCSWICCSSFGCVKRWSVYLHFHLGRKSAIIDILKFMNGNISIWVYFVFVSFPSLLIFGHFILFLECMVIFPWLEDTAITNYKANLKLWVITFSCRDDLLFLWSCSQTGSKLHKPSLWLMSAKLKLGSVFMRSWLWSR